MATRIASDLATFINSQYFSSRINVCSSIRIVHTFSILFSPLGLPIFFIMNSFRATNNFTFCITNCQWVFVLQKATIPVALMLVIVTLYVKSFVCVPSLSSQLLLRIFPNFFDYFGSFPMCLSSRNRSICKASRHIMPYSAPLCKTLHYSKTGVPWQIKSTFIIVINLLFLPGNALFCEGFRGFCGLLWNIWINVS